MGSTMIDWQPIKSAPKDETEVLLLWNASGSREGDKVISSGFWFEGGWCAPIELEYASGGPTHWAPLNVPDGGSPVEENGDRIRALEDSLSDLKVVVADHRSRIDYHADRLNLMEPRLPARDQAENLAERVRNLERLVLPADTAEPAASTGAPKTMTRWVIVSGGCVLAPGAGLVSGKLDAPAFFSTYDEAAVVRDLLFKGWTGNIARVEEVEVIERDGRLIEAIYA